MEKTFRRIGAIVVLAVIGVSACVQIPTSRPVDNAPPELAPATTTTQPEPEPDEPFVYRIGVLEGLSTTNFWAFQGEQTTVWNAYILGPTKPSLYTVHPSTGAFQLELAAEHAEPDESDGDWSVTVALNPGLSWSDGEPITSGDLVFTFETVRQLDLGGAWAEAFPKTIESIEAADPHTVTIRFYERPTLAIWPHSIGLAPIMPAHIWAGATSDLTDAATLYSLDGLEDVGGGVLAIHTISDHQIVSVANEGYTIGTSPDRVEYLVFADETEAVRALNDGAIDTILTPRGLNQDHLQLIDPDVEINDYPAHGVRYLGFNMDREPMSEPAFRTALALLLERDIDTFTGTANLLWYDATAAEQIGARYRAGMDERFAEAIELLQTAGYTWETEPTHTDGVSAPGTGLRIGGVEPQTLTILTPGDAWDPSRPVHAAEIAATLEILGFTVIPVETDFDTVADLAFSTDDSGARQYDMYLLGWTLGNPSLPGFYRVFFASDGVMNNTGYSSEAFDLALERYEDSHTTDQARRSLWEMETILAEDLPYLLLFPSSITEAHRPDRVVYRHHDALGGIQGRLGGIGDVSPNG